MAKSMKSNERRELFHGVVVANITLQYDVLVEGLKNIQRLKADLTVTEKKCIEMLRRNIINEAKKTRDTLKAMELNETVKGNDVLEMVQEYLQQHFIDLRHIFDEIMKL